MVVLRGGAFSYEGGTPVVQRRPLCTPGPGRQETRERRRPRHAVSRARSAPFTITPRPCVPAYRDASLIRNYRPLDHRRASGKGLLWGPMGARFLMSEVPRYATHFTLYSFIHPSPIPAPPLPFSPCMYLQLLTRSPGPGLHTKKASIRNTGVPRS